MSLSIDMDEQRALVIVVEDGHRSTLSLQHQDGIELLKAVQEYYGRLEYGHSTDEKPSKEGLMSKLIARFTPHKKKEPQ